MITNRATRITASTFGVMVGLAGIDHGFFEILQGNSAPGSLLIEAIGPEQRFWEYGVETAFTIVPSFLLSGVLSVIIGVLIVIWAGWFINLKRGPGVLMLLSLLIFLVGGGFAPPISIAPIASLAATRIHKPLTSWRKLLSGGLGKFLGKIWLGSLILFVLAFVIGVEIAIFGWPLTAFFDAETAFKHLNTLAYWMLVLMVLSVVTGFAHDIQVQVTEESQTNG